MLFALVLPLVLMLSVIVVDVGNWWVHRKHLQTLVDAGALAAAPKFVGCSYQYGNPPAANVAIRDTALAYSGDPTRDPATKNLQVQEPGSVHVLLNAQRFWQPGDPMNGGVGLDYTWDIDGSGGGGDPCSERSLDVKATDDAVPLLFGFMPFVADPKRRARVEVRQVVEQNGMLPWAVPEVEPARVAALFVDEINGQVIGRQYLDKRDDVNLPFLEWVTSGLDWSTSPPTEVVPNASRIDLAFENTGVVILVSKVDPLPDLTGPTLTSICTGDPLISCYAGDGNEDGLTFIHGWNDENGTPAVPVIRDVSVLNQTCEDLSAPYFLRTGDCALGARAVIHFGQVPGFNPQSAVVKLFAPGCHHNNGCNMAYSGAGQPGEGIWTTTQNASFADDFFGRSTFSIRVTTTFGQRMFTGVAHPYVAEPADLQGNQAPPGVGAGPVEYLKITTLDPPSVASDANSRNTGSVFPPRTRPSTRRSSSPSACGRRSRSRARSCRLSSSALRARPVARTRRSTVTSPSTSRPRSRTAARRRTARTTVTGTTTGTRSGPTSCAPTTRTALAYRRTRSSPRLPRTASASRPETRSGSSATASPNASCNRAVPRTTGLRSSPTFPTSSRSTTWPTTHAT